MGGIKNFFGLVRHDYKLQEIRSAKLGSSNEQGAKMDTIAIKKMSVTERLQAMEALWESLLYEESDIDTPEWHKGIIEERKRKIKNGKAEFISVREL